MAANPDYTHFVDLVCEGGGVKGIGLAGAFSALEEHGYKPQNVAGTSAGAITAALIAAGYSAAEVKEIIFESRLPPVRGSRAGKTGSRWSARA